jgi:hypothetical protein
MKEFFPAFKLVKLFKGIQKMTPYEYALLVLFPVIIGVFCWYFMANVQNLPHWDDYALIEFTNKCFRGPLSVWDKVTLLFAQHNEHRIAFTRFLFLSTTALLGGVNLVVLQILGALGLLTLAIYLVVVFIKNDKPLVLGVLATLLLLQNTHYENTFWAMASIQNFWVVTFSVLAFWGIIQAKNIGFLFLLLAAYTSANAVVLVPFIGVLGLWYQRQYQYLKWFVGFSFFVILSYFIKYQQPPDVAPIDISKPYFNIKASLVMLGASVDLFPNLALEKRVWLSYACGLLIGLTALYFLWKKLWTKRDSTIAQNHYHLFLMGVFLFCLGTCCISSLSRLQYGWYVFMVSRYRIYSLLALVAVVCMAYELIKKPWSTYYLLLANVSALACFVLSYIHFHPIVSNYQHAEQASFATVVLKDGSDFGKYSAPSLAQATNVAPQMVKELGAKASTFNTFTPKIDSIENYLLLKSVKTKNPLVFNYLKVYNLKDTLIYYLQTDADSLRTSIYLKEIPSGQYTAIAQCYVGNVLQLNSQPFSLSINAVNTPAKKQNW